MATLYKKTLGILGVTLAGMILFIYLSSHFTIMDSFDKIEKKEAITNTMLVKNAISADIEDLERKAAYWSELDKSYGFVQRNSSIYIENNMINDTFQDQKIDFIFIYNESDAQVYKKVSDSLNNSIPVTGRIEKNIEEDTFLLNHDNHSGGKTGLLLFEETPVMISSQQITKNDRSSSFKGTMIMGKVVDEDEIRWLLDTTGLRIKFTDTKNVDRSVINTSKNNNSENTNVSLHHDDELILSYVHFNDIYGKDALLLEISMPRTTHQQGENTVNRFLIFSVLLAMIAGSTMTALIGRSYISRFKKLENEVNDIAVLKDFSKRVYDKGDDEIASLGRSVNMMLEVLKESQNLVSGRNATLNAILRAMPDMMFRVKKDGTIYNYKLSTDSCIYESPENELNISLADVLPENVAHMELKTIEKALRTKETQTMQYTMPVKGNIRDFEVRFVVIGDDEVLAVVKDITEIKQAEEMRRKDLLLKEIHHRVKNNLQIISSLLRLQSRKFTDKETIEAFRKSQNRAKSMAIAHEKLYQSKDLENIELESYIETLTIYLLSNYDCDPQNIKIDINIKNIIQGIDTAIPLGLIINELVSNSLKHAFKEHKGCIKITIHPEDDDQYILTVRDNGIGFPEDIDFMNTKSLGMQLVVSLVEQIEGSIQLIRDNGTEFRITFKELSYKRRDY